MDTRTRTLRDALAPLAHHLINVARDQFANHKRQIKGIDELFHNDNGFPLLIRTKRPHISIDIVEQTGRYRQRHMSYNARLTQQLMQQRPTRAAIAVNKRMNRFELCMHHGRLGNWVYVSTPHKSDKIVQVFGHSLASRRHIQRAMGAISGPPNPNLLIAQLAPKTLPGISHQYAMN